MPLRKTKKMNLSRMKCVFGFSTIIFVSLLSLLVSAPALAASKQSTLSLNISTSTIAANVEAKAAGNFGESSEASISVTTDNFTGYMLRIAAADSTDLESPNGGVMHSIPSAISRDTFSSSSTYNNMWGYKPSQYITTSGGTNTKVMNTDTYLPSPSTSGDIIDITNEANSTANTYTISIGARADLTLPPGVYSNTFIITVVSNESPYSITYNKNTTDTVNNMPTPNPQAAEIAGDTPTAQSYATLSSNVPTRTGYSFNGWCDTQPTEDATTGNQTCNGNLFAAGANFGIDQTADESGVVIYATWGVSKYALTYNYQENYNYRTDEFLDTGYKIDWGKDFKIETIFNIPTSGKRYAIIANYNDTVNTLNIEINTSNQVRLYMGNGGKDERAGTIPTNTDVSMVFTWTAATKTYSLTATASGMSTININGTYAGMSTGIATKNLTTNRDHRGTGTFTALAIKELKITKYLDYRATISDLPSVAKVGYTYSGWYTQASGGTAVTGGTMPANDVTYYAHSTVKQYTITLNNNTGTGGSSTTTATFNAINLSTITNPTKVNTTYTLSGFSRTSSATNSSISSTSSKTSTQTYTFNGWHETSAESSALIASNATTPALQANTTYTDANKKWTYDGAVTLYAGWTANGYSSVTLPTITRTGSTCGWATSSTATTWDYASGAAIVPSSSMTLYGVCRNNITLNGNGATTAGSTSATVNYNATSLSTITLPQRKYTLSGFSLPSSNNASGATVSSTATKTSTYTFNGWYKESGATNKIAGNTTTPALEASTTYTNSSKQWTYTTAGAITLYAGWTPQAVTLPTITKSGYTCGWTETAANATFVQYLSGATITPDTDKTLYGVCVTALTVNFNGNSLEFADGTTTNAVGYHNTDCEQGVIHKYSHTSNINDDGTQIGTTVYENNLATRDIVNIPGASTLRATITYGTEAGYDYLYVFQGEYTGSVTRNMSAGQLATYVGGREVTTTVTLDISGDTATFAFFSDTSQAFYGYYADIVGYDSNGNEIEGQTCSRERVFGEYKVPVDTPHKTFTGWSESSTAVVPTYYSESQILSRLSGSDGETKTLYAVWDNYYVITFVNTDTGATQTKRVKYGSSGTITSPTTWTRTNYSLAGWDTNSAGTNVVYNKNQSVTPSSDITVYTVWKPAYTIQYDGNGADAGVMTNVKHSNVFEGDVFDLYASNFSKANYGFAGWSFDSSAQPGGSSTIYGPNEAITAPAPSNPGQAETKTLYAVWVPAQTGVYMQTWTGCDNLSSGAVIALKDQRDNNVYTVGKLADGNCWMMENLRLDNTNSDNTAGTLAQGYGTGFVGLDASESANFSNSTTANGLYSTANITGSNQGYRFPRYNNTNTSARSTSPSATDNRSSATSAHGSSLSSAIYSYGNYYTWAAAMANIEDLTTKDASEAADTSICPKGWKLPYGYNNGKGNASGGFYYLGVQLGATASNETGSRIWRSYPNNNIYAGFYNGTSASNRGTDMRAWSASANSSTNSYYLNISSTSWGSASSYNKFYGESVRCVMATNAPVTLNGNGATTPGSTTTTVNQGATTLGAITNPSRSYTVSGFTKTASATNSTVSSTATKTSTYTFNGWYQEAAATNKIASNATTPVLQANTAYTDANGKWNYEGDSVVLFAGWTSASVTLPTITRTGSTCGWSTSSTATTITYASGGSLTPTANTTLYGVCVNNITLNNSGATTAGSTSATVNYNATTLSTITLPQRKYTVSGFTKTTSATGSTVSSASTLTSTATFNGWYTASSGGTKIAAGGTDTTPNLQASTTYTNASSQWTYTTAGAITLYSQWTDNAVTLPTITRTGSTCGWSTSSTATTITYASGSSLTPTANTTLYGVCINDIILNGNGATNTYTTSTTVNYGATSLGTIATLPARSHTISGFSTSSNNASGATVSSTSTLTSNYTFNGWYKETGATNKIAGNTATPALEASTTYTNSSKQWTYTAAAAITLHAGWTGQSKTLPTITKPGYDCGWTTTSSGATSIQYASGGSLTPSANTILYGVCVAKKYSLTITFAGSGTVNSVQVRTASGASGGTLMGTISTSGGSVNNLVYGTNYYLYPTFAEGSSLVNWTKTDSATGASLSSTTAANPYYTIGAGNGAVTITATNCPGGKICYDANATSGITGTMGQQTISNTATSATLLASNYSRTSYGFAGWSTEPLSSSLVWNDKSEQILNIPSGVQVYGPNETIEFAAGTYASEGLRLYAVWVDYSEPDYMQEWGALNYCANLNIGEVTALMDYRDNQVYAVARLADGNCWMMENLRLEASNSSNGNQAQGFGGVFTGLANAETAFPIDTTTATANSLYYSGTQSGTATIDIGTNDYPGARLPRYNNINTQSRADSPTSNNANIYSYGNYYNWPAAKANTTSLGTPATSDAAKTSICPAGWHLPSGSGSGEYGILSNSLGGYKNDSGVARPMDSSTTPAGSEASKTIRSFPNNFIYSGHTSGGNGYGWYWSATTLVNQTNLAYVFVLSGSAVTPGTSGGGKPSGYSVRCVANQSNTGSTRITFNKNHSSATGSMSTQTINAGTSVALTTNGFSRSGYQFNSWNTKADGSGTSYANEESYYAIAGNETNNVTLYAQWDQLVTVTFSLGSNVTGINFDGTTYTNGQTVQVIAGREYTITGLFNTKYGINGWSATAGTIANNSVASTTYTTGTSNATISVTAKEATVSISSLTNPSTPVSSNCKNEAVVPELVYDPRDNEAYYVARLCDGKYWMLDNLRLDLTNSTVINALSSSNTNATTTQLNYLKNGGGTTTNQYPISGLAGSEWNSNSSYSVPQVAARFKDDIASVTFGVGSGKVGVYYNYCAVSAGSYCWGNGTSYTGSPTTDPNPDSYRDIEGDICPAGWHLPTGTDTGQEFRVLYLAYNGGGTLGGDTVLSQGVAHGTALSALLSGTMYNGASRNSYGTWGNFWSSTWRETGNMLAQSVDGTDSGGSGGTVTSRSYGEPIRCVLSDKYNIVYDGNGADAGVMTNLKHVVSQGEEITLYASNYSRANYGFAGWSFDQSAQPGGSARIYGPNETIVAPEGTLGETKTLYAVWVASAGNLQSWSGCSSMSSGAVIALKDARDSNVYAISKLADGRCWMIENLRLDSGNSSSSSLAQGFGGVFSGLATAESSNFTNSTVTNSKYSTSNITGSNPAYRFPRYNNVNTQSRSANPSSGSLNIYDYGNYYTWAAAKANTKVLSNTSASAAEYTSICPKGWHLPIGTGSGEFGILSNSLGGYKNANNVAQAMNASTTPTGNDVSRILRSYPNNFIYSGSISGSGYAGRGVNGYYWTSSAADNETAAYYFRVSDTYVYPGNYNNPRYLGLSARCVSDGMSISELTYMQDFNTLSASSKSQVINSMQVGREYTLIDSRDNERYVIAKLGDGRVWMEDNLRLGGNTSIGLSPTNTNSAGYFTLPAGTTSGYDETVPMINTSYRTATNATGWGAGSGKTGVYYNYCAASAGTICSSSNSSNASYDICPAGWRMPTGGTSGEYQTLRNSYSDVGNFQRETSMLLSGYVRNGVITSVNEFGTAWSSTFSSEMTMHNLLIYSDSFDSADATNRFNMDSMRCILK